MTYCVAMNLRDGMVFASDSRTNAGVDHVSTFRKMHVFRRDNERFIVVLSAGNLATSQSVISLLRQRECEPERTNMLNVPSLFQAAELLGDTLREVVSRNSGQAQGSKVDFGATFIMGGQIGSEAPRLFLVYPEGNFIESTEDTPYFQIGESKYGKPIIDRVLRYDTSPPQAMQCTLISFDSTLRSNLSVGLPIDLLTLRPGKFAPSRQLQVCENDAYFRNLSQRWGEGLREVFASLPLPEDEALL